MDVLKITEGKKNEKMGTLMTDMEQQKKSESELLEQIDGKLDTLIAAMETKETEG